MSARVALRSLGVSHPFLVVASACALWSALACPRAASAYTAPPDFVIESAVPNVGFNNPTAIAFTPDGRLLVAEKRGVVRVVQNGVKLARAMWNAEPEVLNNGDRGLLGIAVDPDYALNHYVYLSYVVDPDSDGVDDNDDAFGRVVRYRTSAADSNVIDMATRQVLIGSTWSDGFVSGGSSHSVGALRWGQDKSLLISWGDGSQYAYVDVGGNDPGLFLSGRADSSQDIGAFRAQYLGSLNGKVLRVDRATGNGYPSNPFYDGDSHSLRSRVWVYGCRNPFRFCVRPGTGAADPAAGNPGALFIGDVGWNQFDELNVSPRGGENFGWPCREGVQNSAYANWTPAHHGCASMGTPENPMLATAPTFIQNLANPGQSTPSGLDGRCIIGGLFYTGHGYPGAYRQRFFFGDFVGQWIKTASFDANGALVDLSDFATNADAPIDFAMDPVSGDIHYVSINTGIVYRVRYTGAVPGNASPIARAVASVELGDAPLEVAFSSSGSSDPDHDPIVFDWSFGDGQNSSLPNPSHTYASGGQFNAILTVSDDQGAVARDTVVVVVLSGATFPSAPVIDDFERPNGTLASPWVGNLSGLHIDGGDLTLVSASSYAIWSAISFGPDQEVSAIFDDVTSAAEHSLLMKVQGMSWQDGHVQVHYDSQYRGALVLTYDRVNGWRRVGGPFAMMLEPGDRFGGRAYDDGTVQVFWNGQLVGTANTGAWPFSASGGRVGMILNHATETRVSEFSGGDLVLQSNARPRATILAPESGGFYAAGDTVRLSGTGSDREDASDRLTYRWEVDLHHNTHVHPGVVVADTPSAFFIAEDHDDGTGVWLRARFIVTDQGGMSDTTFADLHPEIDLRCSGVGTIPTRPGTLEPAEYRFTIDNFGRMPAPYSRWRLIAGTRLLAEGDTLVPPNGSVLISVVLPPSFAPGDYDLRVAVDSLGQVVETNEANNGDTRKLTVVAGQGIADAPDVPRALALSQGFPNPTLGNVSFELDLPGPASVDFVVYDVQGREAWRAPSRGYAAGRWTLTWNGRDPSQARAGAGLYFARVRIGGRELIRRVAIVR